jgi:hypothetical protein
MSAVTIMRPIGCPKCGKPGPFWMQAERYEYNHQMGKSAEWTIDLRTITVTWRCEECGGYFNVAYSASAK